MSDLHEDLRANGRRSGVKGFLWALFFSPGFTHLPIHRAARRLFRKGFVGKALSLLLWRLSVLMSGCYFSRMAEIGPGLRLPHPVGIIIGDDVRIGHRVSIYQHVTIGVANSAEADEGGQAYPVIGDDVTIYAGAVLIGPIHVGDGAVIGANSVVTKDVPARTVVAGIPARVIRELPSPGL
jgi:serine O-acetyltransferase